MFRLNDDARHAVRIPAARRLIASASEKSALSVAMKLPLKMPNPVKCKRLLRLLDRLEENGLTYDADAGY